MKTITKKVHVQKPESQELAPLIVVVRPVVVEPQHLNDIYDYFMKARPAKHIPIHSETAILIREGEGGNA